MGKFFRAVRYAASSLAVVVALGTVAAADVNFSGQTVRFINNFGTGSSTDLDLRQLAPYVARALPGNPDFVVESIPGGAGTLAAAQLASRIRPDGLTVGVLTGLIGRWASGEELPVEPTVFVTLGSLGPNQVVLTRTNAGFSSAMDLAQHDGPIYIGAVRPNTTTALRLRLLLDAIGAENVLIPGYAGQLAMVQALQADELHLSFIEMNTYLGYRDAWAEQGVVGLMEFGVTAPDGSITTTISGLPGIVDVWRELAPDTVGGDGYNALRAMTLATSMTRHYVLPPETPAEIARVWEAAFMTALTDPEYIAELQRSGAEPPVSLDGATTVARMEEMWALYQSESVQAALNSVFTEQ